MQITRSKPDVESVAGSRERASVSPEVLERFDIELGQQIRITDTEFEQEGAFTVADVREGAAHIRLGKDGWAVFQRSKPFDALVRPTVPTLGTTYTEAWREDGVAETLWDDTREDRIAILAPHGGDMESNTDVAASIATKRIGTERAAAWMVHYFGADAFDSFHITATRMHPRSYPGLRQLQGRGFDYAISFHLYGGKDSPLLIGGLAEKSLRDELAEILRRKTNEHRPVQTEDGAYMARSENNLVNWLTDGGQSGIQIEMPPYIAKHYRKSIGRGVAEFVDEFL